MDIKLITFFGILVAFLNVVNSDVAKENRIVNSLNPIVIQTPERNYDQPNFSDFEACSKDLDKCKQLCNDGSEAPNDHDECIKKCPICPLLVLHNSVIQGINDTDLRAANSNIIDSTTNVIRLTNEIHNVIDNELGNITARNENNFYLQSKKSSYSENEPCCLVISSNHNSKQRLCGKLCTAHVMYARSVVQCDDENDIQSCKQIIEYKPHAAHTSNNNNRCIYQQEWPFVNCRSRRQSDYCTSMCLNLAYGYILRYGIPPYCMNCFKNFDKLDVDVPPIGYLPLALDDEENGTWALQKSKCRKHDGTIIDDCEENEIDIPRYRRHTYRRSKYSRRNRKAKTPKRF